MSSHFLPSLAPAGQHGPTRPSLRPLIALAAFGVAIVAIMGIFLHDSAVDLPVTRTVNASITGPWRSAMDTVYAALKGKYIPFIVGAAMLVLMALSRKLVRPFIAAATIGTSWLLVYIPKALVSRPRPDWDHLENPPQVLPSDMSFPSGHTTFITVTVVVVYLLLCYGLDWREINPTSSRAALITTAAVGTALVLLIALTVMTRGVHFLTDTVGAVVWSLALTPLVWELWDRGLNSWLASRHPVP